MRYIYNVKITDENLKQLQEILGITRGILNIDKGVFRVELKEEVETLAEKFNIDNVNWKPFDEFQNGTSQVSDDAADELLEENLKKSSEYTLAERIQILGSKVKPGSIVRVKTCSGTIHVVITKASKEEYQGYKMALDPEHYNQDTEIILEKGKDVLYRNLTYRALVRVVPEYITSIQKKDFVFGAGGLIVGRVINKEKLNDILNMENPAKPTVTEDEQNQLETEEVLDKMAPAGENESLEDGNVEEKPPFEDFLKEVNSPEELVQKANLEGTLLATALNLCIESKNSNMKKLLPMLQAKSSNKKMTQNALKNQMNEEMEDWCETIQYSLKEETVTYFLRIVSKRFKN